MAELSLDFIGRQLQSIQAELQQMRFAADVDRRNTTSQYDNLVAAVGIKIGAFEATVEHRLEILRAEIEALRGEMEPLGGEMEALRGEMGALRGEMEALRGDIDHRLDALSAAMFDRFDKIERLISKA